MENQTQNELGFSKKAVEEFSKIQDPDLQAHLLVILQTFKEKDVLAASVMTRGSEDSRTIDNVDITYKDENLENESPIHHALYEICDLMAKEVAPDYEINDGGGFEITFTRNGDVIDVEMTGFREIVKCDMFAELSNARAATSSHQSS